jgi:hypothetical protein
MQPAQKMETVESMSPIKMYQLIIAQETLNKTDNTRVNSFLKNVIRYGFEVPDPEPDYGIPSVLVKTKANLVPEILDEVKKPQSLENTFKNPLEANNILSIVDDLLPSFGDKKLEKLLDEKIKSVLYEQQSLNGSLVADPRTMYCLYPLGLVKYVESTDVGSVRSEASYNLRMYARALGKFLAEPLPSHFLKAADEKWKALKKINYFQSCGASKNAADLYKLIAPDGFIPDAHVLALKL